jgi:hypothetical protein
VLTTRKKKKVARRRSRKPKSAAQIAASKRNLVKARAARQRASAGTKVVGGGMAKRLDVAKEFGPPKKATPAQIAKANAAHNARIEKLKQPQTHRNLSEKEIRTTNIMLGRKPPPRIMDAAGNPLKSVKAVHNPERHGPGSLSSHGVRAAVSGKKVKKGF